MPIDYIPPVGPLPFEFTETGYVAVSDNLLFNFRPKGSFGTLSAAINVMQADSNPTYTYVKACPKYVVGYSNGLVQMMYGRCLYGGIRGLQGIISSYDTEDINASIGTHLPANLSAMIAVSGMAEEDFSASIHGYEERFLTARMLGVHFPVNLGAEITVRQTTSRDLNSFVHAWHPRYLSANITALTFNDLVAHISLTQPGELSAYLNVISVSNLPSYIYSWHTNDLYAFINTMRDSVLSAYVCGRDDMFKNLRARLKGYASEFRDLLSSIDGFTFIDLPITIKATYYDDITAFLYAIQPEDLSAIIQVFHVGNLQGIVIGEDWPFNLHASINPTGIFNNLNAIISCIKRYDNLGGTVHAWTTSGLNAIINPANSYTLSAFVNPIGHSSSLQASIYPKMIRLTTVVRIPTMEHLDMSGIINTSCFYSGYKNLFASIYVTYKEELYAYIKAIQAFESKNLLSKVGYTDSYIALDKLKLCINIYPSSYYTIDRLKLNVSFMNTQTLLSAYIRGTLTYDSLTANISAVKIPKYSYSEIFKNREKVVDINYNGVFKSYQVVETSFKSVVSEYYYNSDANEAWKASRFEKWMLDVSAYLPADTALGLKRRLHRATTLYDLKKFDTVDEAVRFAIDYVTSYPKNDLKAVVNCVGHFACLHGTITANYQKSGESALSGYITPIEKYVLVSTDYGITKI